MRNLSFLFATILVFVMVHGCKNLKMQNQWADDPITIDGNYSDWDDNSLQYFEENNTMMGSMNDADNLYIMFRFNDQTLARKIQMFGVTIWLDEKGKKKKDYGIRYAGSVALSAGLRPEVSSSEKLQRLGKMQQMSKSRPEPGTITIISRGEDTNLPENNPQGPSAASASQKGTFCYEFRITLPLNRESGEETSLGMEVGGIDPEDLPEMRGQTGGMRGGGGRRGGEMMGGRGGRMGGGMRGGGGPRPMGGDRQLMRKMFEKQEMWVKVLLAENPSD